MCTGFLKPPFLVFNNQATVKTRAFRGFHIDMTILKYLKGFVGAATPLDEVGGHIEERRTMENAALTQTGSTLIPLRRKSAEENRKDGVTYF